MKFDLDCCRDILLYLENMPFDQYATIDKLSSAYPKYSDEQITYTCLILIDGGYIEGITISMTMQVLPGIKCITNMTFEGHQLLENIRPETVYKKICNVMNKVGSCSLDIVTQVAPQFLAELVKTTLSP